MGTKQIRVSERLYARIQSENCEGETLSETLERLVGGRSLRDLRGIFDEERVNEMRNAVEAAEREDHDEVHEVAERFE
jgi:predicted CopG family antitoxin